MAEKSHPAEVCTVQGGQGMSGELSDGNPISVVFPGEGL